MTLKRMNNKILISSMIQKTPSLPPKRSKHITISRQPLIDFLWGPCSSSVSSIFNHFQVQAYLSQEWAHAQQGLLGRKNTGFFRGNLIQLLNSFLLSSSSYCRPNSVVDLVKEQNRKTFAQKWLRNMMWIRTWKIINHKATES